MIGSSKQINAQLEYIYIGNYGLETIEDMKNSGMDERLAKEIMRMKLKFAFGKFSNIENLIDFKAIDNLDKAMIYQDEHNGDKNLYISRKSLNNFIIDYDGEQCEINLNLIGNKIYQSPYPRIFHDIPREHFAVLHSGDGDGWNVDLAAMSSVIMHQGKLYVIDAEANIDFILFSLGISINEIEGIFNSHVHDDHFAGISSFMRADHKIKYFSTSFVRKTMLKKLSALLSMEEKQIDNFFEFVDLDLDKWHNISGLEVKPTITAHPIEDVSFSFRVLCEEGYKNYMHLSDTCSFRVLDSMITDDENVPGVSQRFADNMKQHYLSYADIKKIDIGGGMIHGDIRDFVNDKSNKIYLSHITQPLSVDAKVIGSHANIGTVDVLIKNHNNYLRRIAQKLLEQYFNTSCDDLLELINSPIVSFSPDTVIFKAQDRIDNIYLILSGTVVIINDHNNVINTIEYGNFIGEEEFYAQINVKHNYRSENFINLLQIPIRKFEWFIRSKNLHTSLINNYKKECFLEYSDLLKNILSSRVKNRLAKSIEVFKVNKGEIMNPSILKDYALIIYSGRVDVYFCQERLDTLSKNNFLGGHYLLCEGISILDLEFIDDTILYGIPMRLILEVPGIIEKIFEQFIKHQKHYLSIVFQSKAHQNDAFIHWSNPQEHHLRPINNDHDHIVNMLNLIYYMYKENGNFQRIKNALLHLRYALEKHVALERDFYAKNIHCLTLEEHTNYLSTSLSEFKTRLDDLSSREGVENLLLFIKEIVSLHLKQISTCEDY